MADHVRLCAVELLLKQRQLRSLFIDVTALFYDRPVYFKTYREFCRETDHTIAGLESHGDFRDGFTLLLSDDSKGGITAAYHPAATARTTALVVYNDRVRSFRRRNFTLAHEIGHIYLSHKDNSSQNEDEANRFASELLMPSALVREFTKLLSRPPAVSELCEIFALSPQAAEIGLAAAISSCGQSLSEQNLVSRCRILLPKWDEPVVDL